MNFIFPIDEIQLLLTPSPAPFELSPLPNPLQFSVSFASALANLCAIAESKADELVVEARKETSLVAFKSAGDAASIFNVRGRTNVEAVAFGNGLVYGPLLRAYSEKLQGILRSISLQNRVWLTGHGIGAAFALYAASELLARGHEVAAVYTFGAPRVGDRSFVAGLKCPVFRLVNNLDVVPTMPASRQWRHAGKQKLINADGSLNERPNALNRIPSLSRQTRWLGEMLIQGLSSGFPRPLFHLLTQVLGDHALTSYQEKLHALASTRQPDAALLT